MLGIIAGCTQPISSSTLRAWVRVGQRWARGAAAWAPCLAAGPAAMAAPAGRASSPGANSGEVMPCLSAQRAALRPPAARRAVRRCGGRYRPARRTARPTDRWSRSCGRSGSDRGAVACCVSAAGPRAPASSGRCVRAGRRARRRAVGRSGRWRCRSRMHALAQDRLGLLAFGRRLNSVEISFHPMAMVLQALAERADAPRDGGGEEVEFLVMHRRRSRGPISACALVPVHASRARPTDRAPKRNSGGRQSSSAPTARCRRRARRRQAVALADRSAKSWCCLP